jgi:hypothetical protein
LPTLQIAHDGLPQPATLCKGPAAQGLKVTS